MKVIVNVTRVYEMNEERVLSEPGFDPPSPDATPEEKRRWLKESFYELCGFERDEDHLDGSYVNLDYENADTDFDWPVTLNG